MPNLPRKIAADRMTLIQFMDRVQTVLPAFEAATRLYREKGVEGFVGPRFERRTFQDWCAEVGAYEQYVDEEEKVLRGGEVMFPADEHSVALFNQARAIRLAAEKLEKMARDYERKPWEKDIVVLRRHLGQIRYNLDALFARFGKADR